MYSDILKDVLNSFDKKVVLVMLIGPPGSGKSSLANYISTNCVDYVRISPDDLRQKLLGNAADQSNNQMIFAEAYRQIQTNLSIKHNVVFDATNCRLFHRRKAIKSLKQYCDILIGVQMHTSLDKCLENNFNRDRYVPEEVIKLMHNSLINNPPKLSEGYDMLISI